MLLTHKTKFVQRERPMERVFLKDQKQKLAVKSFLQEHDLRLDSFIDELYVLRINEKIVGTGAIYENVLKCIAVSDLLKGTDSINKIMSFLTRRCFDLGKTNLFIYTKPTAYESFEYFGFKKIASSENVVLMENGVVGLDGYMAKLKKEVCSGQTGCVVVNCNPFTLGHQYLIESASKLCDTLQVFVVSEDKSSFPHDVRFELVKKGVAHLDNVIVRKGQSYIISEATFPSYFLESETEAVKEHCKIDLSLFGEKIAKALNISKRFIGEEPLNGTTALYNETMKTLLPSYGVEVLEFKRKEVKGHPISASSVRRHINNANFGALKELLPQTSYDYLLSEAAKPVINKIKEEYQEKNLV